MTVVADTCALVSLGCATEQSLLDLLTAEYEVAVPEVVLEELREVAAYDDEQARAAENALRRAGDFEAESVALDASFPLEDGENAAVTLANDGVAAILLCDEFNKIGLVHASLDGNVKLATTPTFLLVLHEKGVLSKEDVAIALNEVGDVRSWDGNSYVERVRNRL